MASLFNTFLLEPIANFLVYTSTLFGGDFGWGIVMTTVLVRILLFPMFQKALKSQKEMNKLQPEMKRIQKEFKNDQSKQSEELMKLYKERNINPFSSFIILLQLPIIFALYRVVQMGLDGGLKPVLYSFISEPTKINFIFLGLINLKERNIIMLSLAILAQVLQGFLSLPAKQTGIYKEESDKARQQMISTTLITSLIFVPILWNWPAALGLYWLVSSVFSIGQQIIVNKFDKQDDSPKGNN